MHKTVSALTVVALLALGGSNTEAAPDNTLGMAIMGAKVNDSGSLVKGSGVVSVSRNATGSYTVTFDRSVAECMAVASVGNDNPSNAWNAGTAAANTRWNGENAVGVFVRGLDTNFVNRDFQLIVFCPK